MMSVRLYFCGFCEKKNLQMKGKSLPQINGVPLPAPRGGEGCRQAGWGGKYPPHENYLII